MISSIERAIEGYMSTRCDVRSQHKLPCVSELHESVILSFFFTKTDIDNAVDRMLADGRLRVYGPYISDRKIDVL